VTAEPPRGIGSPYVNYELAAEQYASGRSLARGVLTRWGDAVRSHIRAPTGRQLRVADIGAGTGIFVRAWREWIDADVVAIEPSNAMIRAAGDRSCFVRGLAEHLPLATASVDVVWLSTSLHHFTDAAAAMECGRVLAPDGVILIRTHVRHRTEIGWLRMFPGHERAFSRFDSADELGALFDPMGFVVRDIVEVAEGSHTFAESAEWAQRMRHADSVLIALTDAEIAAGVAALRADPSRTVDLELSLVVLTRSEP
jgi:SAM-dependent methyltransferase